MKYQNVLTQATINNLNLTPSHTDFQTLLQYQDQAGINSAVTNIPREQLQLNHPCGAGDIIINTTTKKMYYVIYTIFGDTRASVKSLPLSFFPQ